MNNPCQQHGAFSWCELMTSDVEASKKFYSALFGWTLEAANTPGIDYTCVKVGGQCVGGIMAMPPRTADCAPHWGAYVTVDDVDETAHTAESLGAKILVPPTDIPSVGRFCVLQDPQGAVISAITYCSPCG